MSQPIREQHVRGLAQSMNDGADVYIQLHLEENISISELYSAQLTLLATSIASLRSMGMPFQALRDGIEQLLLRCADDATGKVN